ncbi:MAG: hypothetical protein ACE366_01380 [Bradymonadia bacterium]
MQFKSLAMMVMISSALFGCGDDESGDSTEMPVEGEAPASEAPEFGDHITAGLQLEGNKGLVALTLNETLFEPPLRGDNVWTLSLTEAATGSALSECMIEFDPRMPAHGNHGTSKPTLVEEMGGGAYQIKDLYLFMRGLWVVHTYIECGEAISDQIDIEVWIEG